MVEPSACSQNCGPSEVNAFGTAHGGVILSLANRCGHEVVRARYPQQLVFTDELLRLDFINPVMAGDSLKANARIEESDGKTATVSVIIRAARPGKFEDKNARISAISTIRYQIGAQT